MIASDIIRKQGDTYPIEVSILKENGSPLDLTGAANFFLGVAPLESVSAPDEPALVLSGIATADPGMVSFDISPAQAASIAPGDYFAEIQFAQNGYVITTRTFRYKVKGQIVS